MTAFIPRVQPAVPLTAFDRFRLAITRDLDCATDSCDKQAAVIGVFQYGRSEPTRAAYCDNCAHLLRGMFTPDFAIDRQ